MRVRRLLVVTALFASAAAVACGGSPGPDITRVEATGTVPSGGDLQVMGDTLIGQRTGDPNEVVVSRDGGRTWRTADLPGTPASFEMATLGPGMYADERLAAVVGRDAESVSDLPVARPQFLLWITTDGDEWVRHEFDTGGGIVGAPAVTAVGPILVTSSSSIEGFNLFTSTDEGSSWRRAEVSGLDWRPGDALNIDVVPTQAERPSVVVGLYSGDPDRRQLLTTDDEGATWSAEPCGAACPGPAWAAEDLLHRSGRTSTDGGRSWHDISVEPRPALDDRPHLSTVVEVDGGWLATASTSGAGDGSYAMVLRSSDGRSWRQVLPSDPCRGRAGRTGSRVNGPVRFDGRWYVTFSCGDDYQAHFGVVYAANGDGRDFEAIEATERDGVGLSAPIVAGDRLLIPEITDRELAAVTTIDA